MEGEYPLGTRVPVHISTWGQELAVMASDPDDLRRELNRLMPAEVRFQDAQNYSEAAIKQGTWLTTSLWNEHGWKEQIEQHGGNWQDLMRAFRWSQYDFVKWQKDRKQWIDAMDELIDGVVQEIFQAE